MILHKKILKIINITTIKVIKTKHKVSLILISNKINCINQQKALIKIHNLHWNKIIIENLIMLINYNKIKLLLNNTKNYNYNNNMTKKYYKMIF